MFEHLSADKRSYGPSMFILIDDRINILNLYKNTL